MFLRNADAYLPVHTASQPRRPTCTLNPVNATETPLLTFWFLHFVQNWIWGFVSDNFWNLYSVCSVK
jgi:hypothetical protein